MPAVRPASAADREGILALLTAAHLPTTDLREGTGFLVCADDTCIVGAVGLEVLGPGLALLRSLAVDPAHRRHGLGAALVAGAEAAARARGLTKLYLLTDSAQAFFARHGYRDVARDAAPDAVRAHPQFTALCPASAVVMHRRIDP